MFTTGDNMLYISAGLIAFASVFLCVPAVKRLAEKYGITDKPGPGHPHAHVTAKLGGVAIVGGFGVSLALLGSLPPWIALCTGAMLAVGLTDDILVLIPKAKLVLQLLIAVVFVLTSRPLTAAFWPWFVAVLTVLWLVATTNAFNLIDGLDGLACGIGIITCCAIFVTAVLENNPQRAVEAAALAGALVGFLPYNVHPATIFLGDAGSLPIGFLLGLLSFQVDDAAKSFSIEAYLLPLLVMLVPLLDAGTVTIARIVTGRTISARGLDHLHHRLLSLGLSQTGAVFFCWTLALGSAAYTVTAAILPRRYLLLTMPMVCLLLAPFALFLIDLAFEVNSPGATYSRVRGLARMFLKIGYRFRLVEVLLDMFLAAASYFAVFLFWTNFQVTEQMMGPLLKGLPWVLGATCSAFYLVHVYRGMWRFVGLADLMRFGKGALVATAIMFALSDLKLVPIRWGVVVLFGLLLFDLLLATRVSLRVIHRVISTFAKTEWRILIVGTSPNWESIVQECSRRSGRRTKAIGFVDDDLFMQGRIAGGIQVLGATEAIEQIYSSTHFDEVVISDNQIDQGRLYALRQFAERNRLRLCNYSIRLEELVPIRLVDPPQNGTGTSAVDLQL